MNGDPRLPVTWRLRVMLGGVVLAWIVSAGLLALLLADLFLR